MSGSKSKTSGDVVGTTVLYCKTVAFIFHFCFLCIMSVKSIVKLLQYSIIYLLYILYNIYIYIICSIIYFVSWVPQLTLLDVGSQSWNRTCLYVGDLLYYMWSLCYFSQGILARQFILLSTLPQHFPRCKIEGKWGTRWLASNRCVWKWGDNTQKAIREAPDTRPA